MILDYGHCQCFRFRHEDINLLGRFEGALPVRKAEYCINNSFPRAFYVEPPPVPKGRYLGGGVSPSINRLSKSPGAFNIEIPVGHPYLRSGWNRLHVEVISQDNKLEERSLEFCWDSRPVALPLEVLPATDQSIQEIGQAVDGVWEIDTESGAIQPRPPVGTDVLLLLGSPGGSQEATYEVRFAEGPEKANFIGLSDFFVRHEVDDPDVPIKPGYSSAGLATIEPPADARSWMSLGDLCAIRPDRWMLNNDPAIPLDIQKGLWYRVRHQAWFDGAENGTRFRIWPAAAQEPEAWTCERDTREMEKTLRRHPKFSFGLFQFGGPPTQWRNIKLDYL